jgi:cation:H+ antiporter
VVASTGLAIATAGFALAWGTESLQFVVSQALALAVLAVVNVIPEYSVEVVLAYNGATNSTLLHYATASMTGANRILLGLGWPVVFAAASLAARRGGSPPGPLRLERNQGVGVAFLGLAALYSFVIAARGTLGVGDAAVLLGIFALYVYTASRLPSTSGELAEELEGPSRAVSRLRGPTKAAAIALFVAVGAVAVAFGSEPFVNNFLGLSAMLGLGPRAEYLLIQWLTPVLTELPEAVTVFYWALQRSKGPLALSSLVSSKLNQWTILVATIPAVYSVALGGFGEIHLTPLQGGSGDPPGSLPRAARPPGRRPRGDRRVRRPRRPPVRQDPRTAGPLQVPRRRDAGAPSLSRFHGATGRDVGEPGGDDGEEG